MSKLKNKFNRVGSDASQLQKFADEVCDNFSNEEGKWPDLSESVGTKLYKHNLNDGKRGNITVLSTKETAYTSSSTDLMTELTATNACFIFNSTGVVSIQYQGSATLKLIKVDSSGVTTIDFDSTSYTDEVTPL